MRTGPAGFRLALGLALAGLAWLNLDWLGLIGFGFGVALLPHDWLCLLYRDSTLDSL